jgi:hypothetical protein
MAGDAPATIAGELGARAPGVSVAGATAGDDERFHIAISVVSLIGSTTFLLALMVIRADERRELAGLLRLLGLRRGRQTTRRPVDQGGFTLGPIRSLRAMRPEARPRRELMHRRAKGVFS